LGELWADVGLLTSEAWFFRVLRHTEYSWSCAQTLSLYPFESRPRQNFGADFKCFKSYNSPATIATELFRPSTDSASLILSIKNKLFDLGGGFLLVTSQRRHVFEFLTPFTWPWELIQWAIFMDQTFCGN